MRRGWPQSLASEIENAALCGLWDAAGKYERRKGRSFKNYAYRRIYGAVVDQLRHHDWWKVLGAKRRAAPDKKPEVRVLDLTSLAPMPDQCDHCETIDRTDMCASLVEGVSDERARRALELYFCEGLTMQKVAGELGISIAGVSQVIRKGVTEIKIAMGNRRVFRIRSSALEPHLKMGDFVRAVTVELWCLTLRDCVQLRLKGHMNSHLAVVDTATPDGSFWGFRSAGHAEHVYACEIAEVARLERVMR